MRVSDRGFAEILSHEAIVLDRYKDSVGVWTIGCGHTAVAGAPDPRQPIPSLTAAEAIDLLRRDLARYEQDVERAVKVKLAQHEFDALVSFHFNTGKIGKATFVKKLNAGDRAGAAQGMMAYRIPAEIIERRTKERDLFRVGVYSGDGKVNIYPASKSGAVQWSKGKRVSVASLLAAGTPPKAASPAPRAAATLLVDEKLIRKVQQTLNDKGWPEVGSIDGDLGPRTQSAVMSFRFTHNPQLEPLTPTIDQAFLDALEAYGTRPVSVARAATTAQDLKAEGEPTILTAETIQKASVGALGFAGVGAVDQQGKIDQAKEAVEGFGAARDITEKALDLIQWAAQKWWIAVIIFAAYIIWKNRKVISQRVADHRTGKNLAL